MSAATQPQAGRRPTRIPSWEGRGNADAPSPGGLPGWGRWLLLAAGAGLLGYLLFCHGCHGDEDNELFARAAAGR
jgi:hypothetical protein